MAEVLVAGPDVVIITRWDPANSEPSEVSMVITKGFLGHQDDAPDEIVVRDAELYACDREVEWIKKESESDGPLNSKSRAYLARLNRDTLTKETGIWFDAVVMPLMVERLR